MKYGTTNYIHQNISDQYGTMINDQIRNQFYEKILKNNVQDKSILDIGFGLGLLSFIALKNGAKHIDAYEQRSHVYDLAMKIINSTQFLNKKIELQNDRFYSKKTHHDILIHELLSEDIWGEYLYYVIKDFHHYIIPGEYYVNIFFDSFKNVQNQLSIEDELYFKNKIEKLDQQKKLGSQHLDYIFNPAVNLSEEIIKNTQDLMTSSSTEYFKKQCLEIGINRDLSLLKNKSGYIINANTKELRHITHKKTNITTSIEQLPHSIDVEVLTATEDMYYVLNIEYGVAHESEKLILSKKYPYKSWDQFELHHLNKLIYLKKGEKLFFQQSLTNGCSVFYKEIS